MDVFTLKDLFSYFDSQIYFTLDASAFGRKALAPLFFDRALFAIRDHWVGRVWCDVLNSRAPGRWVEKAFLSPCTSCLVLPAAVNSSWFHEFVLGRSQVYFVKGMLLLDDDAVPAPEFIVAVFHNGAPFVKSLFWDPEAAEFVSWEDSNE